MAQNLVTIRRADAAHMAAVGEIVSASWRRTFSDLLPQDFLLSITPEAQKARHDRTFAREGVHYRVAVDDVGVVGFVSWGPSRNLDFSMPYELYAIYLRPRLEGRGIGRRLFEAVLYDLASSNSAGLYLTSLALNPYKAFYAKLGGVEVDAPHLQLGNNTYEKVAFLWPSDRANS